MTSILEKFISVVAPHHCILCSAENNVLCSACEAEVFVGAHESCYICDIPTINDSPCQNCKPTTSLSHVWIAGTYDEQRRELIRAFKFSRVRVAYEPLARALNDVVPYFEDVVVVPLPTASSHVRVRGYDHAALLARELARQRGWRYAPVLRRQHNLRQVGASKALRARQAASAYELIDAQAIQNARVLLVDDVTTSGASLTAAAQTIQTAQPLDVCAAVIAKHTLS